MGDGQRIAVVTVAIPERLPMLAENLASIAAQTLPPVAHFVSVDYERVGATANLNRTVRAAIGAGADWIAQLADDDLAYPHHLETLASAEADVVYSWCDVEGRDWSPNAPFDPERLQRENYIPATTLIRSSLIVKLGYWREGVTNNWEDWDFWRRALAAGSRFVCVPIVTWRYRFHGTNASMEPERQAQHQSGETPRE